MTAKKNQDITESKIDVKYYVLSLVFVITNGVFIGLHYAGQSAKMQALIDKITFLEYRIEKLEGLEQKPEKKTASNTFQMPEAILPEEVKRKISL